MLLGELFENLLKMLDNKRFGVDSMGRAWAATYVLRDNFTVFLPLILACLDGDATPSLDQRRERNSSTLRPTAQITQEAASSLASVFDMVTDWRTASPEQAVPILSRGLRRWPLRRRFVEALAQYRSPEALHEMITFAAEALAAGDDPQILCEISKALGDMGQAFGRRVKDTCREQLQKILECDMIDARTRRTTIASMNMLDPAQSRAVPEVTEAEIIENLRTFTDATRQVYTDWRLIKEYAEEHAYNRIIDGRITPELLDALIAALDHDQTYARTPVARCLGLVDDPRARAALLDELAEPRLPAEVRKACVEALRTQIRQAPTPAIAAARRWLAHQAAHRARMAMADVTAEQLAHLAEVETPGADTPLVYGGAFEIVAPGAGPSGLEPRFRLVDDQGERLAEARRLITAEDLRNAGKGWEPKYRIDALERTEPGTIEVRVAKTTWEEAVGFHLAVRRDVAPSID